MGLTYSCPRCGTPHLSQYAADHCTCGGARTIETCPRCHGSQTIPGLFGNNPCPDCGGTGVKPNRY